MYTCSTLSTSRELSAYITEHIDIDAKNELLGKDRVKELLRLSILQAKKLWPSDLWPKADVSLSTKREKRVREAGHICFNSLEELTLQLFSLRCAHPAEKVVANPWPKDKESWPLIKIELHDPHMLGATSPIYGDLAKPTYLHIFCHEEITLYSNKATRVGTKLSIHVPKGLTGFFDVTPEAMSLGKRLEGRDRTYLPVSPEPIRVIDTKHETENWIDLLSYSRRGTKQILPWASCLCVFRLENWMPFSIKLTNKG